MTHALTHRVSVNHADGYCQLHRNVLYDHTIAQASPALVALLHDLTKAAANVACLRARLGHVAAQLRLPREHAGSDAVGVDVGPLVRVCVLSRAQWTSVKVRRNAALAVADWTHGAPAVLKEGGVKVALGTRAGEGLA